VVKLLLMVAWRRSSFRSSKWTGLWGAASAGITEVTAKALKLLPVVRKPRFS
jgi:hypothetical protein